MATFLFDKTVFGPVKSRRLGVSLGINLLPNDSKLCSFDCIYCECGWNPDPRKVKAVLPTQLEVYHALELKLVEMVAANELPDVITFAGNGEPTMHPFFAEIVDDTIILRNKYAPKARIAVLSNSTMLFKPKVVDALKKVDDNILKLDAGNPETIQQMNLPVSKFDLQQLVKNLMAFEGKLTIQTMFLRGNSKGQAFDNTTKEEVTAWVNLLKIIHPERVMIYSIDRDTPSDTLQKVNRTELEQIAKLSEDQLQIKVEVSA
jgi:wyosine [tRNA(Phe)-imidazoG37] synthetase (radical SAM superfamily)